MKKIKKVFSLLPMLIIWLMISVFLWGFVFTRITDTDPLHKVTLFIDCQVPGSVELAVELEKNKQEIGIRMVKVHPFTYAMLDSSALRQADLYIVRQSDIDEYADWFVQLPEEMLVYPELLNRDGTALGIRIYSAEAAEGAADRYIDYTADGTITEDYYLLFGKESVHVPENEGAVDGAALDVARSLLSML